MKAIKVLLDTDIGPDCDDTAALAILNLLCDEGAAELLAVTHCTGSPYGVPAISAINRRFGRRAPIGTCPDRGFLSTGAALAYTPRIAAAFPHDFPPGAPQPGAVEVFREALLGAADGSVTVVAIGPLNNLASFLRDEACARLIAAKVQGLVAMAGSFRPGEDFVEWNVEQDVPAARHVARRWPTPILFCPFEAGEHILTGASLARYPDDPVALSYRIFTKGGMLRPSWDLLAVVAAVLGAEDLLPRSGPGRVEVTQRGETRFTPQPGGAHRYLLPSPDPEALTARVEALLERALARSGA